MPLTHSLSDLPYTVFTTAQSSMIISPYNYLASSPVVQSNQAIKIKMTGDFDPSTFTFTPAKPNVTTAGGESLTCMLDMVRFTASSPSFRGHSHSNSPMPLLEQVPTEFRQLRLTDTRNSLKSSPWDAIPQRPLHGQRRTGANLSWNSKLDSYKSLVSVLALVTHMETQNIQIQDPVRLCLDTMKWLPLCVLPNRPVTTRRLSQILFAIRPSNIYTKKNISDEWISKQFLL